MSSSRRRPTRTHPHKHARKRLSNSTPKPKPTKQPQGWSSMFSFSLPPSLSLIRTSATREITFPLHQNPSPRSPLDTNQGDHTHTHHLTLPILHSPRMSCRGLISHDKLNFVFNKDSCPTDLNSLNMPLVQSVALLEK